MTEISEAAAALGKKGGRSKSPAKKAAARRNIARAQAVLSPEARRLRAQKAAQARWDKATASPGK